MKATPILALFALLILPLHAQGNLDPPAGGPQASMKTLQQVEPRVDVSNAPATLVATDDPNFYYVIRQPGSYYLSRNGTGGGFVIPGPVKPSLIKITADDVTLDLNGFRLSGSASTIPGSVAADTAIQVTGNRAVILNGAIRGFPTPLDASDSEQSTFERLRVTEFSVGPGIHAGNMATVAACTVSTAEGSNVNRIVVGNSSLVRECAVLVGGASGGNGILVLGDSAQVRDSVVEIEGSGNGIRGGVGGVIIDCVVRARVAQGEGAAGITVTKGKVRGCLVFLEGQTATGGSGRGFNLGFESVAEASEVFIDTGLTSAVGFSSSATGMTVRDCTVRASTPDGVTGFRPDRGSELHGCSSQNCETGFSVRQATMMTDCIARNCSRGFDLSGASGSQLQRCSAEGAGLIGFHLRDTTNAATLRSCNARGFTGPAGYLVEGDRNRLLACQADSSNSHFVVTGDNNYLADCVATQTTINGGTGFLSSGTDNTVIRCQAKNCSVNYSLNASSKAGPIVNDPINATNPFSNFSD